MYSDIKLWIILGVLLVYINIVITLLLLIKRLKKDESDDTYDKERNIILNNILNKEVDNKKKISYSSYFKLIQSIQFNEQETNNLIEITDMSKQEKSYIKGLKSRFKYRKIKSATYLGFIATDKARLELEYALTNEKNNNIKFYIANALSDIDDERSIKVLVSSLIKSNRWYRDKVNMLIADFGEEFNSYLPDIIDRKEIEIKELIVDFSTVYFSSSLKDYLVDLVDNIDLEVKNLNDLYKAFGEKSCMNCIHGTHSEIKDKVNCKFHGMVDGSYICNKYKVLPVSIDIHTNYRKLAHKACNTLAYYYPKILLQDKYLYSDDIEIRNIAIKSLSKFDVDKNLDILLDALKDDEVSRSAINAISKIIEIKPQYINKIAKIFSSIESIELKHKLARILSIKIEYFIVKLNTRNKDTSRAIIEDILSLGMTNQVIDFLNKNKNMDLENELISIINKVTSDNKSLEDNFSTYLNERIVKKCNFVIQEKIIAKKEEVKDKKLLTTLYLLIFLSIAIFPIIYFIRRYDLLFNLPFRDLLKIYVLDFNYYIAFYSIAINLVYILLLILSYIKVNMQIRLWRIRNNTLFFKKRVLPSISIIAPAFNEEKTIVESSNSLLNLKYPDYELIIVNDGSKDNTLNVLIKYFNLTRVDYIFENKLSAKPVRGIYRNPSIPKLIVVDKENGGKADSLNTGINIANKEYFCGIDADSLLEEEAMLKLASLTLNEDREMPALGGNVFPINGSTVEKGQIVDINIPKNNLARFQTIEYIRAFMAGRLGWAYINSLLIISGAFGLFRKDRIISVGGYLTSSGKYQKDTVGEDMELVVRISRLMRELGLKYKIAYAFNANCWTEVPESLSSLKKQRYRWHKGLIDILNFHKRMIFNPRYGRAGLVAMPYFFIFEMIGPIVEVQGYIMVLLALVFGLLNVKIALILFVSTILLGIFVSISSILISEKDMKYFKIKDLIILIVYAVLENFGPRQLFSFWRVGGLLNMFKSQGEWDKSERKGFTSPR